MVKAELSYNPYLMETKVKFNGQSPKINCMIEKYQDCILQTWITKVPKIFHDEMNGYCFELDFSGTVTDCSDLQRAFDQAGVTRKQVVIHYKNELEDRNLKIRRIDDLLAWLGDHRSKKFDYDEFFSENQDIFSNEYPLLVIQGEVVDSNHVAANISVEYVDSTNELADTDLTNTPLVFYLSSASLPYLSTNLQNLSRRNDVLPSQLFFIIDEELDSDVVERVIIDLGVAQPQIISGLTDEKLERFISTYPITDSIYHAIQAFRKVTSQIGYELDQENRKSQIEGKEIHTKIDILDGKLSRLKETDERIVQRDNVDFSTDFQRIATEFYDQIKSWRKKKTKITKKDVAMAEARQFDVDLHDYYAKFFQEMLDRLIQEEGKIRNLFRRWYEDTKLDSLPEVSIENKIDVIPAELPSIQEELSELRQERYLSAKDDILGKLFRPVSESKEGTVEINYYYQEWRGHILSLTKPMVDQMIEDCCGALKEYSDQLAAEYHSCLTSLIGEYADKKSSVVSQLSEGERHLQAENDWLSEFVDQLKIIERG